MGPTIESHHELDWLRIVELSLKLLYLESLVRHFREEEELFFAAIVDHGDAQALIEQALYRARPRSCSGAKTEARPRRRSC